MAWDIRSEHVGPVHLPDINILLMKRGDIRDLDLLGREHAERSNDVRIALVKGLIITLRKDPPENGRMDAASAKAMSDSAAAATAAVNAASQIVVTQGETISRLSEALTSQQQQNAQLISQNEKLMDKMQTILSEVQAFSEKYPVEIRTIKAAMENISFERETIAVQKEVLSKSEMSEAEMKTQERILSLKDKKLERNGENLGKSVSKSADHLKDIESAMDALGI